MYEAAENNCWDDAEKMAYLAYELYEEGRMELALAQLEEAIEINPNNAAWHFNAGLTLDAMDRFDDAIEAYQKALEQDGDDPEILNSLAVDYTRIGKYDLAISTFENIQQIDPGFEPGYCNRIITYTEIDDHDKAEEMFYTAQQLSPDCPICFYNIGNSLFSRQNYKKAIWCWEKTAEIEPTHPQINYRIAQAHWADGNMELANRFFLEELRNNPGSIDVILDFGIFLLKNADNSSAAEKFNRIIELDPDFAQAYFYLAEIALNDDNNDKATELYLEALSKNPKLSGPKFRLAQIAIEAGNKSQAMDFLKQECELDIDDVDVLFSMGIMFMELDELDLSMNCYLRIIDEDPENVDAFYHLGSALSKEGEYEGALQFLEHAVNIGKDDAETLADNAYLYLKINQVVLAKDLIKRAKEKDPSNSKVKRVDRMVKIAMLAFKTRLKLRSSVPAQNVKLFFNRIKCRVRRSLSNPDK